MLLPFEMKMRTNKLIIMHAAINDSLTTNPWIDEYGRNRSVDPFEKSR